MAVSAPTQPVPPSPSEPPRASDGARRAAADEARAQRRRASRRVGLAVTFFPATLALALIANGVRRSSNRSQSAVAVEAERDLERAISKVPFAVRLPVNSATRTNVVRVVLDEPNSKKGPDIYTLNVYYNAVGPKETRSRDSVWSFVYQTNDTFITARLKDPLNNPGEKVTIAGEAWFRVRGVGSTNRPASSFTRRFDDGITVVVEAKNDVVAKQQIEALQKR